MIGQQPPHRSTNPPHDEQRSSAAVSPLVSFMVLISADAMCFPIDDTRSDPPAATAPPPALDSRRTHFGRTLLGRISRRGRSRALPKKWLALYRLPPYAHRMPKIDALRGEGTVVETKRAITLATLAVLFSGLLLAATPAPALTLKPFSAIGSGAPTADDCSGSINGQCSVTFGGTVKGSQIGTASITATLSVNHSTTGEICLDNPGCTDQCFAASGTGTITTKNGSTITLGQDGLLCPVPPDSTGGENFSGSFMVTGGTKKFASAIGSGLAGAAISADGSVVTFTLTGTLGTP